MLNTLPLIAALLVAPPDTAAHRATHSGEAPACTAGAAVDTPRVVSVELAGVPANIRIPSVVSMAPIVLWHGFGPPADEAALMALLPLDDVPAVKVYLGLPMFGERAPRDPGTLARRQAADLATGVFEPVVMGAGRELPGVVDALRREGCLQAGQGIGVFGFSAGGAAALYALAEGEVPIDSAVVLNASTGLSASVAAYERSTGQRYDWTPAARALARHSDAASRAGDIARGPRPPALLIMHGADDAMLAGGIVHGLHDALVPHYAPHAQARLRLEIVEGMPHAVTTPGDVARVRELVGDWFRRHG